MPVRPAHDLLNPEPGLCGRHAWMIGSLFRYGPDYARRCRSPRASTGRPWPGPQGGLLGAVEMCNNNGTCRKFDAGSMCPSYRVTRDEAQLTRGRANTLRLALTGQLGPDALAGDDVAAALKLCVSCKACRRECPTGVDMAKMKIEAGAARVAKHGVRVRERLVAELPRYAPWAARVAPLANLRNRVPLLRRLGERAIGIAAERPLPEFRSDPFHDAEIGAPTGAANEVILFGDTFNRYYEPENLRAAVRVLRRLGLDAGDAKGSPVARCAAAAPTSPPGSSIVRAKKPAARSTLWPAIRPRARAGAVVPHDVAGRVRLAAARRLRRADEGSRAASDGIHGRACHRRADGAGAPAPRCTSTAIAIRRALGPSPPRSASCAGSPAPV